MTTGGWVTMLLSVGSVCLLFVACLYKVFSHNPEARDVTRASLQDRDE